MIVTLAGVTMNKLFPTEVRRRAQTPGTEGEGESAAGVQDTHTPPSPQSVCSLLKFEVFETAPHEVLQKQPERAWGWGKKRLYLGRSMLPLLRLQPKTHFPLPSTGCFVPTLLLLSM